MQWAKPGAEQAGIGDGDVYAQKLNWRIADNWKMHHQSHSAVAMDTILGALRCHYTVERVMQSWAQIPGLLFFGSMSLNRLFEL